MDGLQKEVTEKSYKVNRVQESSVTTNHAASMVAVKGVGTMKNSELSLECNIILNIFEESRKSDPLKRHTHGGNLVSGLKRKCFQ